MRKIKPADDGAIFNVDDALLKLVAARDALKAAGASKRCVDKVRIAGIGGRYISMTKLAG